MQVTSSPKRTTKQTGCYLYAILAGADSKHFGPCGIDGSLVYTISDGGLAAVVSDVPRDKLRPERRRLAAHHEVLKQLLGRGALLPMAFGIISEGTAAIERILDLNQEPFAEQLARLTRPVR